MGKNKKSNRKRSMKSVFAMYMVAGILSALVLSLVFSGVCQFGQSLFYKKYKGNLGVIELRYDEGSAVQVGYMKDFTEFFTPSEIMIYNLLGIFSGAVYPLFFVLSVSVTSLLFYKWELQRPLEILGSAADKIADNDLDFEIFYRKQDELGKLCVSFEKMRAALRDSYVDMWRQIEERRRLNAAFSHDLRTPLTVLKGQSEMLAKYAPQMSEEKVARTAEMMGRHIARLERYVYMMNDLQRLEDVEIDRQPVRLEDVVGQICAMGRLVCKDKVFLFAGAGPSAEGENACDVNTEGENVNHPETESEKIYNVKTQGIKTNHAKTESEKISNVKTEGIKAIPAETVNEKINPAINRNAEIPNIKTNETYADNINTNNIIINVDMAVVMRVYENLLANAVRFAEEKISVFAGVEEGLLKITVADDGSGFTARDLSEAVRPFYKSTGEKGGEHFGMGLNICKILCEKHGGQLRLENCHGACVTAAFRQ